MICMIYHDRKSRGSMGASRQRPNGGTIGSFVPRNQRMKPGQSGCEMTGLLFTRAILLALFAALSHGPGAQDTIQTLAARGEGFEKLERWEDAAAAYRQILKIDARSIAALNRLGAVSVHQKKFEEAVRYYRRALALNPYEFGTNLNLGIAYIKMQDYGRATIPLERATEAEPSDFQARELLAVALIGRNDYAQAIPHL